MYHVSAQGVDERIINVHYYYYKLIIQLCVVCQREAGIRHLESGG